MDEVAIQSHPIFEVVHGEVEGEVEEVHGEVEVQIDQVVEVVHDVDTSGDRTHTERTNKTQVNIVSRRLVSS